MRFRCHMLILLAAGLLGFAGTAAAQIAVYMRIDGLPGESTDARHPNEIVLDGYTQTFGTRNCSRVVALKSIDRASPGLIARAAQGTPIPQVTISMARDGGRGADFFRATLDQVTIDRVELGESADRLQERVVLQPRAIVIWYLPQRPDGSAGTPVTTSVSCH